MTMKDNGQEPTQLTIVSQPRDYIAQLSHSSADAQLLDSTQAAESALTAPFSTTCSKELVTQRQYVSPAHSNRDTHLLNTGPEHGSTIPFLELPAEIRNLIYGYLFPECPAMVQLLARHSGEGYVTISDRLGLLCTCRQVYEETTSFLRSQRRVKIVQPASLQRLFQAGCYVHRYYNVAPEGPLTSYFLPPEGIRLTYDLDDHTLNRNTPEVMYVNGWFCDIIPNTSMWSGVVVKMRMSEIESTFSGFEKLGEWLSDHHLNPFPQRHRRRFAEARLVLAFELSTNTSYKDLRFEANNFLDALRKEPTGWYPMRSVIESRITRPDGNSYYESFLLDILGDLLNYMHNMMIDHPELESATCPKMMFDGVLRVKESRVPHQAGFLPVTCSFRPLWSTSCPGGLQGKGEVLTGRIRHHLYPGRIEWLTSEFSGLDEDTLLGNAVALARNIRRWAD